jgi:kynurenine formamidase
MTEYRARVDGDVSFTNGGGLTVRGFLLDLPSADATRTEVADLLVAALGLLMAGPVELTAVEIIEQAHKGTRGGPSGGPAGKGPARRLVELNHPITEGMVTYPGLPAPTITPFLTRAEARDRYADGTEFAMDCITLIGNTGTYLDSPYHRYEGGTDLAGLGLAELVDLPAVVVRITDSSDRGVTGSTLTPIDPATIAGAAVLIHSGDAARFGTPEYAEDAAYLARDGAQWLVEHGAALVGIDSVNIDAVGDLTRPAHSILLAAGIPIVEHMTGLDQVPPFGATFTALPPRVVNFGTFPVRAFASVPV